MQTRGTRKMTDSQLDEARSLRLQGWSKRSLARKYGVGCTTIWENLYRVGPRPPRTTLTYRTAGPVRIAVGVLRQEGLNSMQVARRLTIPPEDVNWIWTRITTNSKTL